MAKFDPVEYGRRLQLVGSAFSPSAPITSQELFEGRTAQMAMLLRVAGQAGQHAVVYGERGVGKTSLAQVVRALLSTGGLAVYFTCSTADTFGSIWTRAFAEVQLTMQRPGLGFGADDKTTAAAASELLGDDPQPDDVRRALTILADAGPVAAFVDEYDRIQDGAASTLFADTIKILSDQAIPATVVLVGVGDTVDDLVREHASVHRSLVQVQMQRMTGDEISGIVARGMEAAEMAVEQGFTAEVIRLSQGLPHYAHLLGQQAAYAALESGRAKVLKHDVVRAVETALDQASETVRDAYHRATSSNRETIYATVLLACALARKDEQGTFGAPDVRDQLHKISPEKAYDIPAFATHLNDFSSTGRRGGILQKRGETRMFRYRFVDSLLPPYILLRGRADGIIS